MAAKRKSTNPPAISSSSEEEEGSASEEITPQAQTPKSPPSKKPQPNTITPPQPKSSSEEETNSETDPEPVSQKRSVAAKPNPASPPPPKSTKRANESAGEAAEGSKRARVADDSSKKPEDANRGRFERLWSEDDEIVLLKGIIKFEEERGMEFRKDWRGFFDFIVGSLHSKVNKFYQVKGKIRKLKEKFEINKLKWGMEPKFANSYDQDCFDLSKRLWGSAGGLAESSGLKSRVESSRVKSGVAKERCTTDVGGVNKQGNSQVEVKRPLAVVQNVQEAATVQADSLGRHFVRSFMGAANMEEMVEGGMKMLQGEKKTELEDRLTKYQVDRLEMYVKRLDLLKEQSLLVLEELKSSLVGKL